MKTMISIIICFIFSVSILTAADGDAKEINFKISLSSGKVSPGKQVLLKLVFPGQTDIPALEAPFIEGLDCRYKEALKEPISVDGQILDSITYTYSVVPLKEGDYRIGPITFEYNGNTYISTPVMLYVSEDILVPEEKRAAVKKEKGILDRIYLEAAIPRHEVFVNEKVPVTVKFYTDWLDVEDLDISDTPSSFYIAGKYDSKGTSVMEKDGDKFAVLEFEKWFFVPEPGEFSFGPVKAKCKVTKKKAELLNDNEEFYNEFIGRGESCSLEIETEPFKFKVINLPAEGHPENFKGAIGDFTLDVDVSPREIETGDTINLTFKLSGEGNYNTVSAPQLKETAGFQVYEPQVSRGDNEIVFKQLLKVQSPEVQAVPEITFSFFDPAKREYFTITKEPIPLNVTGPGKPEAALEKAAETAKKETPRRELIDLKSSSGGLKKINPYFYRNKGFVFLEIFPLFLFCAAVIVKKRLNKLQTDTAYAGWLYASRAAKEDLTRAKILIRAGKTKEFYNHIFKTMQRYIGRRFVVPAEGITEVTVYDLMGGKIEHGDAAERIKNIFSNCYLATYTLLEFDKKEMKEMFKKAQEIIDYLNTKKYL